MHCFTNVPFDNQLKYEFKIEKNEQNQFDVEKVYISNTRNGKKSSDTYVAFLKPYNTVL